MYVRPDFATKAALKRAVAAGEEVTVFAPGYGTPPANGETSVEGPHAPKPHTWYARITLTDGKVTGVK